MVGEGMFANLHVAGLRARRLRRADVNELSGEDMTQLNDLPVQNFFAVLSTLFRRVVLRFC